MSNTSFILDGSPKSLDRLDAFKKKKKFQMHIILDGSLMSLQRLDAFEHHRNVKYIFHVGGKSDAAAMLGYIELERSPKPMPPPILTNLK
jgi:tRNA A37 methylthiotransferase MiaB